MVYVRWMILLVLLVGCTAQPAARLPNATVPLATNTTVLTLPTSTVPVEIVTVFPDRIEIIIPGYRATCIDPVLSIPATDGDGWKPLEPYSVQPHYRDETFMLVFGMCDYVECRRISAQQPIRIDFPLYDYRGERPHTFEDGVTRDVPVYNTIVPSSTVRLEIPYYPDATCDQQQLYTTIRDLAN